MKLELEIYGCLCSTAKFIINDINADSDDFGEKYDHDEENAEDYACGDMKFDSKPATQKTLDKYKITVDEYREVCEKLEDGLSFGCCGWCV